MCPAEARNWRSEIDDDGLADDVTEDYCLHWCLGQLWLEFGALVAHGKVVIGIFLKEPRVRRRVHQRMSKSLTLTRRHDQPTRTRNAILVVPHDRSPDQAGRRK
jgi:hypothetical protein